MDSKAIVNDLTYMTECTVMALREALMEYFKGGIGRLLATNVHLLDTLPEEANHRRLRNYEVRGYHLTAKKELFLGPVKLGTTQKNPNILTLYQKTLQRSPELQGVQAGIEAFMHKYLQGVNVVLLNRGSPVSTVRGGDVSLLKDNHPRDGQTVSYGSALTVDFSDSAIGMIRNTSWTIQ